MVRASAIVRCCRDHVACRSAVPVVPHLAFDAAGASTDPRVLAQVVVQIRAIRARSIAWIDHGRRDPESLVSRSQDGLALAHRLFSALSFVCPPWSPAIMRLHASPGLST